MLEKFVVGRKSYAEMKKLIRENASHFFPDHVGHTLVFEDDSPHVLWARCLDCDDAVGVWTRCNFCIHGGRHGSLDFGCRHKCQPGRFIVGETRGEAGRRAARAEGDSVRLNPQHMEIGQFYFAELKGRTSYLYRKVSDHEVEVYELA